MEDGDNQNLINIIVGNVPMALDPNLIKDTELLKHIQEKQSENSEVHLDRNPEVFKQVIDYLQANRLL